MNIKEAVKPIGLATAAHLFGNEVSRSYDLEIFSKKVLQHAQQSKFLPLPATSALLTQLQLQLQRQLKKHCKRSCIHSHPCSIIYPFVSHHPLQLSLPISQPQQQQSDSQQPGVCVRWFWRSRMSDRRAQQMLAYSQQELQILQTQCPFGHYEPSPGVRDGASVIWGS